MGKYLLDNVHAQFPNARLGIVVADKGALIRGLFAAYPWLEIIEASRRNPRSLVSLWWRFKRCDLVVTQYAGKPGGSFSMASKLAARLLARRDGLVGFVDSSRWNRFLYNHIVPVRQDVAVADHDRTALTEAGLAITLPYPTLEFVRESVLTRFGLEKGKYVVVHLFSGNAGRGLHPDKKHELLTALSKKLHGTCLVISGGDSEREEALQIAEHIPATVVAGEVTLQDMMNLIHEGASVVSVDTGIAHIAAQLGKPLTVLRSCLGANWWLPGQYGNEARITVFEHDEACAVGHVYKDYPACINSVDVAAVARQASA